MKVLNLRCAHDHRFEGWFASGDDFAAQSGRGLVECPLCGDKGIERLPSAPRLNVMGLREEAPAPAADAGAQLQSMWLRAVRHMIERVRPGNLFELSLAATDHRLQQPVLER